MAALHDGPAASRPLPRLKCQRGDQTGSRSDRAGRRPAHAGALARPRYATGVAGAAGIIGPPPRGKAKTNLYASGPGAADLEQLAGPQLIVRVIGEGVADASALKMCYGALNKGTQALWLDVLIAATSWCRWYTGTELLQSQADRYSLGSQPISDATAQGLSLGTRNARRIRRPWALPGVSPKISQGAADIYRFVADVAQAGNLGERQGRRMLRRARQAAGPPHGDLLGQGLCRGRTAAT